MLQVRERDFVEMMNAFAAEAHLSNRTFVSGEQTEQFKISGKTKYRKNTGEISQPFFLDLCSFPNHNRSNFVQGNE